MGAMRRSLEARELDEMLSLMDQLEEIETSARALDEAAFSSDSDSDNDRDMLVKALHRMRREAHICLALAESEALYLRFRQSFAPPAPEYSRSGAAERQRPSQEWEA